MSKPSRSVTGVIPTRYDSLRFIGKPLVKLNGQPMIRHGHAFVGTRHAVSKPVVSMRPLGGAGE